MSYEADRAPSSRKGWANLQRVHLLANAGQDDYLATTRQNGLPASKTYVVIALMPKDGVKGGTRCHSGCCHQLDNPDSELPTKA